MTRKWSPADIGKLTTVCSGCSCLVILVGSVAIGVVTGKISAELLGSVKGLGVGGGLVGLSGVLYLVIRFALNPGAKDPAPSGDLSRHEFLRKSFASAHQRLHKWTRLDSQPRINCTSSD